MPAHRHHPHHHHHHHHQHHQGQSRHHTSHGSRHKPSELFSNPAFSYYPDEELVHFYPWTSPPGVMKIMSIIIIILCVAIFACVASTLAWDYDMSKGFMIAISAITFLAVLVIFILVVSRQNTARSPTFYLAAAIISGILAGLMIIATIVYLVAVNPTAQTSSSGSFNQIMQLCAQYQNQNQASGIFLNQYLYHYCVVEPQEAIAIVMGVLVFVGLIILLVFALKTRQKIRHWGPERILWEEPKVLSGGVPHTIGEWVTNVSGSPDVLVSDANDLRGSRDYLDQLPRDSSKPLYLPGDSDITSSVGVQLRDQDGADSADELDQVDFSWEFPSILSEQQRLDYKRDFEQQHQEFRDLQADLDHINQSLAGLERDLGHHAPGSPQYLDDMEEYTRLKNVKKSPEYQLKKKRCKHLRSKLSHIKRKISEYDRRS